MPKNAPAKRIHSKHYPRAADKPRVGQQSLSPWEWGCVGLAIIIAFSFYLAWLDFPILHDAAGYVRAAKEIRANGLFSKYELSDIRTYGWPLLLSWLIRLSDSTSLPLRAVAFEFELLFHLFACYMFRFAIQRTTLPQAVGRALAISLLLNPLVLIFTSYLLTESVSFSLLILLLAASAYLTAATNTGRIYRAVSLGSLVLGSSIMIRPTNVCMAPVWWGVVAATLWRLHPRRAKTLFVVGLTILLTFLPMAPQWLNNVTYYHRATPLLANNVSNLGVLVGIRLIKYATAEAPNLDPRVMYENPFFGSEPFDPASPLSWYVNHPLKGLATIGLHIFNLLDQDQPFPYTPTLLPAYYPAAALANMLLVCFGLIGVLVAGWRVFHRQCVGAPLYGVAVATLACQIGMQALFSVEARYGIPLLMLLYMFAAWLVVDQGPKAKMRSRVVVLTLAVTGTCVAYPLSLWVRQQSPSIRAALEDRAGAGEARELLRTRNPVGTFVSGSLDKWLTGDAGVGRDGEAILAVVGSAPYSILYYPVTLQESTNYVVEFEARAPAGSTAEMSVDLYAGSAYDRAEQNSVFRGFTNKYQRFKAEWNSGPDAPTSAFLRFVTVSKTPIQIRHVSFYKSAHQQ
jgi:hypothetical protein